MKTLATPVVLFLAAQTAFASAITYTDANAWLEALTQAEVSSNAGTANVVTENFTGNQLHVDGLSVVSQQYIGRSILAGTGQIAGEAWTDQSLKYELTTWTYSGANGPLYGWGGYFAMPSIQSGLEVFGDDFNLFFPYQAVYPYPDAYPPFSDFWGFVSTTPFTYVDVTFGEDGPPCGCYSQTYTMDNLELGFAAVDPVSTPEPTTAALAMVGLLGAITAVGWRLRKAS